MPQPKILYVVDNNGDLARCLSRLLVSPTLKVEIRHSAEELLASFDAERAACVLVDSYLPGMSSAELARELRQAAVSVPVFMMAWQPGTGVAAPAIAAVAEGLERKPFDSRAVGAMLNTVGSAMLGAAKAHLRRMPSTAPTIEVLKERFQRLTSREREVVQLAAQGHTSKELASALNLSKHTVDNHRARILAKLELDNFVQVTRFLPALLAEQ